MSFDGARGCLLAVALVLAGCATVGTKIDSSALAGLRPGETTVAQAVAALGPPTGDIMHGNGVRMLIYSFAQSSFRPATFIPIVGAFAGGVDTRSNSATLIFKPDGTLDTTTTASMNYGVSTGLISNNQPSAP